MVPRRPTHTASALAVASGCSTELAMHSLTPKKVPTARAAASATEPRVMATIAPALRAELRSSLSNAGEGGLTSTLVNMLPVGPVEAIGGDHLGPRSQNDQSVLPRSNSYNLYSIQ